MSWCKTEEDMVNEPLSNVSDSSFVILGKGSFSPLSDDEFWKDESRDTEVTMPTGILPSAAPNKNVNDGIPLNSSTSSNPLSVNELWKVKSRDTEAIMPSGSLSSTRPSKNANDEIPLNSSSASNNFLGTDAQDKLNHLLQENYRLKETLNQNNLAIKSQLNTFFMWQQEVLKTHETHKQKFMETKDMILKLKTENNNLKKQLEDNMEKFSFINKDDLKVEDSSTVCKNIKSSSMCNEEIEKLKQNIKQFEMAQQSLEMKNDQLSLENNDLQGLVLELKKEIMRMTKEKEDVERENVFLKSKSNGNVKNSHESFVPISLPNSEARVQISNLLKQLEEERSKVAKLKNELEKVEVMLLSKNKSPSEELTECVDQINNMNHSFKNQNERYDGLNSWVCLMEDNVALDNGIYKKEDQAQILSEITQLKSCLKREELNTKEKEKELQIMHDQFTRLLNDYQDLQKKLGFLESNDVSAEKYKSDINSLTLQLKEKEVLLKSKNEECDKLVECIKTLNLECEKVPLLKVQAELYESDFNDERAAREKLAGEKEEMAEQVRILQNKIKDLEEEKEQKSNTKKENENPAPSVSPLQNKKNHYVCPKCMFAFSDLNRCHDHIDECLNIHFYP